MFAGARYVDSSGGEFKMERSNAGFQAGDVILGTSDSFTNNCLLMEVTAGAEPTSATAAANKNKVHRKTGTYQDYYQGRRSMPRAMMALTSASWIRAKAVWAKACSTAWGRSPPSPSGAWTTRSN
jgi:hypothetical protein